MFSGKNKINTAARKIKVQTAGTHKPLIQAIPFRILKSLWERASFVWKRGHKETSPALGFPWIPLKGQNSPTELLQNLQPFMCYPRKHIKTGLARLLGSSGTSSQSRAVKMMVMWPILSEFSSDTRERRPSKEASWRGWPPCPLQKAHLALEPHLLLLDARCFLQG